MAFFGVTIHIIALAHKHLMQFVIRQRPPVTAAAAAPAKATRQRAVNLTHPEARLSRQQTADACVRYCNEVLAAEGSYADEYSAL